MPHRAVIVGGDMSRFCLLAVRGVLLVGVLQDIAVAVAQPNPGGIADGDLAYFRWRLLVCPLASIPIAQGRPIVLDDPYCLQMRRLGWGRVVDLWSETDQSAGVAVIVEDQAAVFRYG